MAHRRGTAGRGHSLSSPLPRKKYSLRRSPSERGQPGLRVEPGLGPVRHQQDGEDDASRGPLLPLHQNLRRLPSRLLPKFDSMDVASIGQKRKRNENNDSRPDRGSGRSKRLKAANGSRQVHSSDEDSDSSRDDDEDDQYFLGTAPSGELLRLRKDELLRLYTLAGLLDGDGESATKAELVDAIISARDDLEEDLPPSSPRDGDSSGCSSGEEEVRRPGLNNLRRRATTNGDLTRSLPRPPKTRSLSWGVPDLKMPLPPKRRLLQKATLSPHDEIPTSPIPRKRTFSFDPIPEESVSTPLVTRLRSRKNSVAEPSTPTRVNSRGKGKAKQVEFTNSALQLRTKHDIDSYLGQESDLTDLEERDSEAPANVDPSPRRLRSKDRKESNDPFSSASCDEEPRQRKASLRKRKSSPMADAVDAETDMADSEDESQIEADEVDELVSTASGTPQPSRRSSIVERTPVKRRLRSSGHLLESQGTGHEADVSEEEEEDEQDAESAAEEEEPMAEGRRLRSGKIVGEDEDIDMKTADEESVSSESEEMASDTASVIDLTNDDEDEVMEDADIDLSEATTKTLVRLRRDDLVRLCETHDLEAVGTKPQLAEALLQWRDRRRESSGPSSSGTLRPPSTAKKAPRKGRKPSLPASPPLLLRESHGELSCGPRTPTPPKETKEPDPELELDLESLGLDDREIPPEKLTKLEKIGSGGFKDVFIGKFKGRKIAISEFRGQLNAMDIKELKLLGGFNHPNIVRFLGVSIPENTRETPVMIVSELCSNGDLFDYVRNVPPPSLIKLLQMMLDIAKGLEYLHLKTPSIIHRDCKSSNILITSKGTAKIADFGLAKVKQSTRSMVRSLVGTVNWQAPELWHPHPKYNHKVDVFSCAMVYWEMLQWHVKTKKFPWEGMNEHAIYDAVGQKHQRPSVHGLKKLWCSEVVELVEHMWAQDPSDRPTISQVVSTLEDLIATYR